MGTKCVILLAVYNGEAYIKEQLESILNQKGIELEVYVSDDFSTDNTLCLIEEFKDDRIHILPKIERSGSAAQNFFRLFRDTPIELFDYVAFADQDDIWTLDKISRAIFFMKSRSCDGYSSNVLAFWENGKEKIINKSDPQRRYDHLFSSPGPGCTQVFSKRLSIAFRNQLEEKKILSKKIDFHDWLIYAFARENGYKWFIDSKTTMKYRQHSNNVFGANSGLKALKSRWYKSREGWYRNQIMKTAEFCNVDNKIIKHIKKNSYLDRIMLSKNLFELRRNFFESVFLGLVLLIPGYK